MRQETLCQDDVLNMIFHLSVAAHAISTNAFINFGHFKCPQFHILHHCERVTSVRKHTSDVEKPLTDMHSKTEGFVISLHRRQDQEDIFQEVIQYDPR